MRYLALATLLLTGCATSAGYERMLNKWVGHHYSDLVAAWGVPSQQMKLPSGELVLEYNESATGPTYISRNYADRYTANYSAYTHTASCRTTFTTSKIELIKTWSYEGNACKAR